MRHIQQPTAMLRWYLPVLLLIGGCVGGVAFSAMFATMLGQASPSMFAAQTPWTPLPNTPASSVVSTGSSGGLWRVSTEAASCTSIMCPSGRTCTVIAGALNSTAYAMNACNEVFYYDSSSWIMIAGQTGYTPADRSRRRLRDDLDEDHDGLGRPIDRPDGMVDGVVVHDATLWALLTDHRTVRRFDPITILWTDGVVAESDLSAARSWQVKLDLNACSATHDDQGYLWYSTRTSTKNADVSCNTLTVCPPQVQQTTDLEKCQQVYGGSVQSFAVNAHGGGAMVEIWIVDAQGQVYYDTVAQANRTAAPPSPLPVDALLSSSPTPGTSLSPDTPAATPPGPVGSAALSQHGNAVVVSFTAPANSGSSPITDFVVTAVPATGTPGSPPNVTITGSSSPVVLHGLQDQVLYTVHISAESAAGASADVQVGPAFTYHMATPGAPSNLTVTATGVVTFAPTTAGASTIDGYRVLAVPACGGANVTVSGHSSPLQLSGLVNGQTYTVSKPEDCTDC